MVGMRGAHGEDGAAGAKRMRWMCMLHCREHVYTHRRREQLRGGEASEDATRAQQAVDTLAEAVDAHHLVPITARVSCCNAPLQTYMMHSPRVISRSAARNRGVEPADQDLRRPGALAGEQSATAALRSPSCTVGITCADYMWGCNCGGVALVR